MDIASKTEAGKQLMKFAGHSQCCAQPHYKMISRRQSWLVSLTCLVLFALISLHPSQVISAPADKAQVQERKAAKAERKAAKAERKRQKKLKRKAKQLARKKQKQLKQQKRIQKKGNKTVITLNKNTKIKIKPKGDTTKVVVVKKKKASNTLSHTSTIEKITELASTGADAKTIRKAVDEITPDKYPRHARTGPKTVIQFDESGLIGFKMKNKQVTLDQALEKSPVIKKFESRFGELEKIKVKNTNKKTRVVSVFKQVPATKPVTQPPAPKQPEPILPAVQPPAVNHPVVEVVQKAPVQQAPVQQAPVQEVVTPVTNTTPSAPVVNMPTVSNTPPAPVIAPVIPVVTTPDPVIQTPAAPVSTPNTQQPVVTASITQRIEGTPKRSDVSQPLSVLNLGGSPSVNTPPPNNPPASGQPAPQFNARIADTGENLETDTNTESTLGDMPVHKISYLDTSGYRQQSTLFSTTGTGISLNVEQCEELEACAPAGAKRDLRSQYKSRQMETDPISQAAISSPVETLNTQQSEEESIDLSLFADADQTIEDDE